MLDQRIQPPPDTNTPFQPQLIALFKWNLGFIEAAGFVRQPP
jgi:hypothetical protein